MKVPDENELRRRFVRRFGVAIDARIQPDQSGVLVRITPTDLHPNEGFSIDTLFGWRTVESRFRPGPYAGGLVAELGASSAEERRTASAFLAAIQRDGGRVSLSINGSSAACDQPETWPRQRWSGLDLSVSRTGIVVDQLTEPEVVSALDVWAGGVLGALVALARVEETAPEPSGLPEGARQTVIVNRYERSRVNRAACIAALGSSCLACGFDFGEVYGRDADGFIHVHHVRPVSQLGPGYIVDPTRDLIPVCANCHAFIHLRTPPYDVQEVKEILAACRAGR